MNDLPDSQAETLRAMAKNYAGGHRWDHLDGEAAVKAAEEIDALRAALQAVPWRCFHCDEVFTTKAGAEEHFGKTQACTPACQMGIEAFRSMETELEQRRADEDGPSAREFYALGAEHAGALRREEEKGYERGVRDARELMTVPRLVAALEEQSEVRGAGPAYVRMADPTDVILDGHFDLARVLVAMKES